MAQSQLESPLEADREYVVAANDYGDGKETLRAQRLSGCWERCMI